MHRLLICAMVLAGTFSIAFAEDTRPTAKYSPPSKILDRPLAQLEESKGKGLSVYSTSASGKELAHVEYAETWFDLPDPVKAQYLVFSEAPQTVHQITLGFKDTVKRDDIIAAASKVLGTPEQGKSGPDAPSKYYAQWVKDAVRYDFQDYGDYREMYISLARFSYAEKYKLKEPIFILEQQVGKPKSKGREQRVMLLADQARSRYNSLWLYVCTPDKEEQGELLDLGHAEQGTTWDLPKLNLVRPDGAKRDEINVSVFNLIVKGDIVVGAPNKFRFAEKDGKITLLAPETATK